MSYPNPDKPLIIVGSGLAGFTLAREFRKLNPTAPVTMLTNDSGDFYSKPMLSTGFANQKSPNQLISSSREQMQSQLNIQIQPFTKVESIDEEKKILFTTNGSLNFEHLVLGLGADPIRLNIAGNAANEVISVNDLSDYQNFREKLIDKHNVLILGAGLIGCEFANDLTTGGFSVTVVDLSDQPLNRLLPKQASEYFQEMLGNIGVRWKLGTTVKSITKSSSNEGLVVELDNGDQFEVDVVLSAVGLRPRTELASTLGISVNRGICVNRFLESSHRNIFALGDCAEVDGLVLPYVMPIMHCARALAQTLGGKPTEVSYPAMPVAIKTPAIPTIVAPPINGISGKWVNESLGDGFKAQYIDELGKLQGFALLGSAVSLKAELTKQLPSYHAAKH